MNSLTGILYAFAVMLIVTIFLTDDVRYMITFGVLALTAVALGTLLWVSQVRGWGRDDDY